MIQTIENGLENQAISLPETFHIQCHTFTEQLFKKNSVNIYFPPDTHQLFHN